MLDAEASTQVARPPSRSQWRSSKLRDTCQACATCKVKCPKEKPSCSRCKSRGIACEYSFTKRPGRRRGTGTGGRSKFKDNISPSPSRSNTLESTPKSSSGASPITPDSSPPSRSSPNTIPDNSWSQLGDTIYALPYSRPYFLPQSAATLMAVNSCNWTPRDLVSPTSPSKPENTPLTDVSDLDATIFSDLEYLIPDVRKMDFATQTANSAPELHIPDIAGTEAQAQAGVASCLIPAENDTDHDFIATPVSPSSSLSLDLLYAESDGASDAILPASNILHTPPLSRSSRRHASDTILSSSCGCMSRALNLLNALSRAKSDFSTSSGTLGRPEDGAVLDMGRDGDLAHTILVENRQAIEAVEHMLACPSFNHDGFLLIALAMTVLKILERYAVTAAAEPGANDRAATLTDGFTARCTAHSLLRPSSYGGDNPGMGSDGGQSSGYRHLPGAHLVLGELHRAQRVVSKLSPRLNRPKTMGFPGLGLGESRDPTCDFSMGTLEKVGRDVRKSLATLSAEVISSLRQR